MQTSESIFEPIHLARAVAHLTKPRSSVIVVMHSGDIRHLTHLEDAQINGRISGLAAGGFPVTLDSCRIESFTFAQDECEELPIAPPDLLGLTIQREDAIVGLLAAIESKDMHATLAAAAHLHEVQHEMAQLSLREPSQMVQDRPGEFGGYEGAAEPEIAASAQPGDATSILGEPDVVEKFAGPYEPKVIDHPWRGGRPPKSA